MKYEKTNINLFSNVYPVIVKDDIIDLKNNCAFISKISDDKALIKLTQILYGINGRTKEGRDSLAKTLGIQDWQIRKFWISDACDYDDPGEISWGYVIKDGKYYSICKCQKKDCPKYKECRPGDE